MVCDRLRTAIRRADFAAFRASLGDAIKKPKHALGDGAEEPDVDRMTVLLQLCADSHGAMRNFDFVAKKKRAGRVAKCIFPNILLVLC